MLIYTKPVNRSFVVGEIIPNETVFYTTFSEYPGDSTRIYERSQKVDVSSTVSNTTANSIQPGVTVASFDGSRAILVPTFDAIGTGEFTIETWFRIASADISGVFIFLSNMVNNVSGQNNFSLGISGGRLYTVTTSGSARATTTDVSADVWHHACAQRTGTTTTVFLDGAPINSYSHITQIQASQFRVGSNTTTNFRYFKGLMASAAITKAARYPESGFTPTYPLFPFG